MKPRLLDLFCGPGGAGMGYHRAGFEVVGVDIMRQPRYPFEFIQADALTFPLDGFDAIHASPPCQAYSRITAIRRDYPYPDLIGPTRDRLAPLTTPWVIENVPGAPLDAQLRLCGSMFGLQVRRHRLFEANWQLPFAPFSCDHRESVLNMYTSGARRRGTDRQYINAMGVTWATTANGGEAIPPAYTEWIGRQLLSIIERTAA